jgi:hypothetical protein
MKKNPKTDEVPHLPNLPSPAVDSHVADSRTSPGSRTRATESERAAEPSPAKIGERAGLSPPSVLLTSSEGPGISPRTRPHPSRKPTKALGGEPTPERVPTGLDIWLTKTLSLPLRADNRRDTDGNTPLMRAARAADFLVLVELLGHPDTNIYARDADGRCAYDLLKASTTDHTSPEFLVISQALFLRTMLNLMIREEHFANIVRGVGPGLTARQLAEKVAARLSITYLNQQDDRALPFAAMPSVDFIEAMIRLM